jgi:hypothetical protein
MSKGELVEYRSAGTCLTDYEQCGHPHGLRRMDW